jgi:hypothetical protein
MDKDTLRSHKDCAISIHLSRSDKKSFSMPASFSIGDEAMNVDLMYQIERFVVDSFVDYRCKESIAMPVFPEGAPDLKKWKSLHIIDSLKALGCIVRGRYRLRVLYNYRNIDGGLNGPIILSKSNWVEFFVESEKLLIGDRYRLIKKDN